jgi:hypothetical protein
MSWGVRGANLKPICIGIKYINMEYTVSRTSQWSVSPDEPPCKEAVLKQLTRIVQFPYGGLLSIEDAKRFDDRGWFKSGNNHRVENGNVVKDVSEDVWTVEIKNLVEFFNEHGHEEIIIMDSDFKEIPINIEFYDDYRD